MFETNTMDEQSPERNQSIYAEPGILIVDDDEGILRSLSQVLSMAFQGYHIFTAASAEEALDVMNTQSVDIVLTDLKLPQMNGLELMRHVQDISPDTKSILMTAYGNDNILHRANETGCLAYLQKPFEIDSLVKYINFALNPMGSNMRAELSGLSLADVIQIYASKDQTVVLSVMTNDSAGTVAIEKGVVCHAQYGHTEGPEALEILLGLRNGFISTLNCAIPKRKTLLINWKGLQGQDPSRVLVSDFDGKLRDPVDELRPTEEKLQVPLAVSTPSQVFRSDILRVKPEDSSPSHTEEIEDDGEQYTLQDEEAPPRELTQEDHRSLTELIDLGIEHFRRQEFDLAGRYWIRALRIDPSCAAARKNLQVLERAVTKKFVQ